MGELIGEMAVQFILCVPTKKKRIMNKKFKLLRQQKWFQERYGSVIMFQSGVREFVLEYDIEKMLKNDLDIMVFQKELNGILIK
ncbi:hypothetical protein CN354_11825 [Bacillus cereus]|uniref:hypothetical protein n=1 Tax=Bacillus pseudomycoides TaxID=64104 RepID=UPI000BF6710D|nr:hypothetical protein [Bacillus pseudomycoides]PEY37714.1 hypothetical protein CN354_11825 [Bacillus cereus]WJE54188.1 hypothetical protein QRE66_08085 [Bacillus cereus]